jgi:carboxymethylenebutenolidase
LTAFYRDNFIFRCAQPAPRRYSSFSDMSTCSNPRDARLELISRTVGSDRIVDEFIFHMTHDTAVDWLLPGVPPTGKTLAIPMVAIVNVRGDRLAHGA